MKKSFAIIAAVVALVAFVVVDSVNGGHKIIGENHGSHPITAEAYANVEDSVNNALEAELSKLDNNDPTTSMAKSIARRAVKSEMHMVKDNLVE